MFFSPLSNHQTVVNPRSSWLNFYEGTIPVSEFVHCEERGNLGVERNQRRTIVGSTCLSVSKESECERESGHSPRDDHTETNLVTYEAECVGAPVRCLLSHRSVQCMLNEYKREKKLNEFSVSSDVAPKFDFTNHQFETSVLDPPMSLIPLSNQQSLVKPRYSRLNFYEGYISSSLS
jgi:hypothetical protein